MDVTPPLPRKSIPANADAIAHGGASGSTVYPPPGIRPAALTIVVVLSVSLGKRCKNSSDDHHLAA
jgi:hypothetical protein